MNGRRVVAAVGAVLLIILLAGGVAGYFAWQRVFATGPLANARDVVIPRGAPADVGDALQREGVIDTPMLFVAAAEITRSEGTLHAGELAFPAHASLRDVLTILRTARPVQHRLTIPEGLTAAQIAQIVDRAEAAAGETPVPAEGQILPETYAYERGASRTGLIARAEAAMTKTLAQTWAERAPGSPLTDPRQMLTLASIVERETARPEERPHVAGVFLNRLRLGMKLQSDPTVIYGVSGGAGVLDHPLTRRELDTDNPYNTYRIAGLPPGPIASPGRAALEAVAHPTVTDDLYFVADGTGGHVFSRTVEEHNRNVARWRALQTPAHP
jgi:UPF0755 protein